MNGLTKWALVAGLLAAVAAAFVVGQEGGFGGDLLHATLPWVVGGLGVACGALSRRDEDSHRLLLASTGLVVGLTAILLQNFNPAWLNDIVYFARVFFAHVLLATGLAAVLKAVWT